MESVTLTDPWPILKTCNGVLTTTTATLPRKAKEKPPRGLVATAETGATGPNGLSGTSFRSPGPSAARPRKIARLVVLELQPRDRTDAEGAIGSGG
jgi:hypothetical protein